MISLNKYKLILIALAVSLPSCGGPAPEAVRYRNTQAQPMQNQYYQHRNPYYQNQQPQPQVSPGYTGGYGYPPASKYYSNPYSFPPANQYPYYDTDRYYVPPTRYGTNDYESDGGFEKF